MVIFNLTGSPGLVGDYISTHHLKSHHNGIKFEVRAHVIVMILLDELFRIEFFRKMNGVYIESNNIHYRAEKPTPLILDSKKHYC